MKKIYSVILIAIVFASCATAPPQDDYPVFYKKYKHNENVVNFGLPTGLIASFLNNKEDKELKQFLKNVDRFTFFIAEDSAKVLLPILDDYLPNNLYKDVMIINDSGDKVTFKARESEYAISEIIMLVEEDSSFVVMCIEGDFTYEQMNEFIKSVDKDKVTN